MAVRYRKDGQMYNYQWIPHERARGVVSRLKVLSGLDITQKLVSQDGRLHVLLNGKEYSFRISTMPTQFGESVVLRVLDSYKACLGLENLGMPKELQQSLIKASSQHNGMILVAGPTGSGKTTTLYGLINKLNKKEKKILTAEDPVEYVLEGVQQVNIDLSIGLGFNDCLKAFLRHDPDVMMVGEIRDRASAQISLQAALTGHLVFSTLHAFDAASVVVRLIDMGVEAKLIPLAIRCIVAQRLVRIKCSISGYGGRRGIFECLHMNDELAELIVNRASVGQIRRCAQVSGMITLSQQAEVLLEKGLTTYDEVKGLLEDDSF